MQKEVKLQRTIHFSPQSKTWKEKPFLVNMEDTRMGNPTWDILLRKESEVQEVKITSDLKYTATEMEKKTQKPNFCSL